MLAKHSLTTVDKRMLMNFLFLLGISVEAVTGALAAGRKKMDFFGVIMIACITGLGGGSVRDLLLDIHPLVWIAHPHYLLVTSIAAILTITLAPHIIRLMRVFLILDALGLATFVVIGTHKALTHQLPLSVCVIAGTVTGITGGMLRDILCNDIPLVLRREIYALIALFGSVLYISLLVWHLPHAMALIISLLSMFALRVLAITYHIEMPKFDYHQSLKKTSKLKRKDKAKKNAS